MLPKVLKERQQKYFMLTKMSNDRRYDTKHGVLDPAVDFIGKCSKEKPCKMTAWLHYTKRLLFVSTTAIGNLLSASVDACINSNIF